MNSLPMAAQTATFPPGHGDDVLLLLTLLYPNPNLRALRTAWWTHV